MPHESPPVSVGCWVLTVSDTRTPETDRSGDYLVQTLEAAGHRVLGRRIVPDDAPGIGEAIDEAEADPGVQVVLVTGGTGISDRDVTPEVVAPRLVKTLPGFGEIFRVVSYEEIGPAAMFSRAIGGVTAARRFLFALPGSTGGCRTALEKILLPQMGHLVSEITK